LNSTVDPSYCEKFFVVPQRHLHSIPPLLPPHDPSHFPTRVHPIFKYRPGVDALPRSIAPSFFHFPSSFPHDRERHERLFNFLANPLLVVWRGFRVQFDQKSDLFFSSLSIIRTGWTLTLKSNFLSAFSLPSKEGSGFNVSV